MFDLSFWEIIVIAVIAMMVVKPEDMPDIMRSIGKAIGKVKRSAKEFMSLFDDVVKDEDLKEVSQEFTEIIDLDGNVQKAYDISDLDDLSRKPNKPEVKKNPKNKKSDEWQEE